MNMDAMNSFGQYGQEQEDSDDEEEEEEKKKTDLSDLDEAKEWYKLNKLIINEFVLHTQFEVFTCLFENVIKTKCRSKWSTN